MSEHVTKRVKLVVAYDGTAYCGWQIQPNGNTVQAELEKHLSDLLREPIHIMGASRTDAGVHARGNVAVFDTHSRMDAGRISYAMNTRLPQDIRIQDSCQVSDTFHPRFQRTIKTYRYQICNTHFPDPVRRLYSFFYHYDLDVERMQRAADYLVGEHDFTSFCTDNPQVTDHVRHIYRVSVTRDDDDMITVMITGNGFLYNMVRIIVGTLIRIGNGRQEPEEMAAILEGRDRSLAGDTARPEGLTLMRIEYPDSEMQKNA